MPVLAILAKVAANSCVLLASQTHERRGHQTIWRLAATVSTGTRILCSSIGKRAKSRTRDPTRTPSRRRPRRSPSGTAFNTIGYERATIGPNHGRRQAELLEQLVTRPRTASSTASRTPAGAPARSTPPRTRDRVPPTPAPRARPSSGRSPPASAPSPARCDPPRARDRRRNRSSRARSGSAAACCAMLTRCSGRSVGVYTRAPRASKNERNFDHTSPVQHMP